MKRLSLLPFLVMIFLAALAMRPSGAQESVGDDDLIEALLSTPRESWSESLEANKASLSESLFKTLDGKMQFNAEVGNFEKALLCALLGDAASGCLSRESIFSSKLLDFYLARRNYSRALPLAAYRLSRNEKDEKLGELLGMLHLRLGAFSQARSIFEKLHRDNPEKLEILFGLGASSLFESLLKGGGALAEEGKKYLNQARELKRASALLKGIKNGGRTDRAPIPRGAARDAFHRGEDLFAEGRYEDAAAEYRQVMKLDPSCARGYFAAGDACSRRDMQNSAREYFTEALLIEPDYPLAAAYLAEACHRSFLRDGLEDSIIDAVHWYSESLFGDPDPETARRLLAARQLQVKWERDHSTWSGGDRMKTARDLMEALPATAALVNASAFEERRECLRNFDGDRRMLTHLLSRGAVLFSAEGNEKESLDFARLAVECADSIDEDTPAAGYDVKAGYRAVARKALGQAYLAGGKAFDALKELGLALEEEKRAGEERQKLGIDPKEITFNKLFEARTLIASLLDQIGFCLSDLGNEAGAYKKHIEASEKDSRHTDLRDEARALLETGRSLARRGQTDRSLQCLRRAEQAARLFCLLYPANKTLKTEISGARGDLLMEMLLPRLGRTAFNEALASIDEKDRKGRAHLLCASARALLFEDKAAEASQFAERALVGCVREKTATAGDGLIREVLDSEGAAEALYVQGLCAQGEGRTREALDLYKTIVSLYASPYFKGARTVFLGDALDQIVDLLFKSRNYEEALSYTELCRALEMTPFLPKDEEGIRRLIESMKEARTRYLASAPGADREKALSDMKTLERKLVQSADDRRRRRPGLSLYHYPALMSIRAVQQKIIGEKEAVIEYEVTREKVYCWVIASGSYTVFTADIPLSKNEDFVPDYMRWYIDTFTALRKHEPDRERAALISKQIERLTEELKHAGEKNASLPLDERSLTGRVNLLLDHLENRSEITQPAVALIDSLYRDLFAQAHHFLKSEKIERILIIPDGPLWQLPFPVLSHGDPADDKAPRIPLMREYTIAWAPSLVCTAAAAFEPSKNTQKPQKDLLAMAWPFKEIRVPDASEATLARMLRASSLEDRGLKWPEIEEPGRRMLALLGAIDKDCAVRKEEGVEVSQADSPGGLVTGYWGVRALEEYFRNGSSSHRILHLDVPLGLDEEYPHLSCLAFSPPLGADDTAGIAGVEALGALAWKSDLLALPGAQSFGSLPARGRGWRMALTALLLAGKGSVLVVPARFNTRETEDALKETYVAIKSGTAAPAAIRATLTDLEGKGAPAAVWATPLVLIQKSAGRN